MKKIMLYTILACIMVLFANMRVYGQGSSTISRCNTNNPNFSSLAGTVSFATTQTWNSGPLVWSDVVRANVCNKATFNGGTMNQYLVDCRSNPGQKGNLFSFCAVAQHKDVFCPAPWRVPDVEDFRKLDSVFDGENKQQVQDLALLQKYVNDWGATYTGYCTAAGQLYYQDQEAYYWALSEEGEYHGMHVRLYKSRFIVNMRRSLFKYGGLALRCVKDL